MAVFLFMVPILLGRVWFKYGSLGLDFNKVSYMLSPEGFIYSYLLGLDLIFNQLTYLLIKKFKEEVSCHCNGHISNKICAHLLFIAWTHVDSKTYESRSSSI